jgi:hypothetical protein
MRLTLRTLLAWLDGVLPEADRGPLGDKVAASPVARQLVDRIEAVTARPQVPAPRVEGRGLAADPNTVAQYLDNTLPTDQLEPFERVCLESDSHLAEVASCHRMLAELAADPGVLPEFDAAGRARLLAALRHASSGPFPATARDVAAGSGHRGPQTRQPPQVEAAPRRRIPWLAWVSASVAILLVAALAGLLARSLIKPRGNAAAGPQVAAVRVEPGKNVPPQAAAAAGEGPGAAAPERTAAPASAEAPEAAPSVAVVAPPGEAPVDEPVAGPLAVVVNVPAAGVPAMPEAGSAAADAPLAAVSLPAATPPSVPITVGGEWPLLWRQPAAATEWTAGMPGTALPVGADLVVPPGCTPEITVADVVIRLMPQSRAVITVAAEGVPRLELVFGRALVRSSRPDAALALSAAGLAGSLVGSLTGGLAVEVALARAPGDDPATVPALTTGRMIPVATGVRWTTDPATGAGTPAEVALESRRALAWDARDPGAITVAEPGAVPGWVAGDGAGSRLERAAAAAFRARLLAGGTAEQALTALAASRRVEERSMAAATLALLGRFETLVALLVADTPPLLLQNRQWETVEAGSVPLALARGANAAARLRQTIVAQAPAGKGDFVWRLATGFTPEEIAAGAAEDLLSALDDDALVVRRYALLRLVQATHPAEADRLRYRPDAPAERRRAGVEWWQRWLREGQPGRARGR